MIIKNITDFDMDQNCYIVYKEKSKNSIVIDPGNSYEKIKSEIEKNNLDVCSILITHCHYDHISELKKLKDITGAEVISGIKCVENIKNPKINVSVMFGKNESYPYIDRALSDGECFVSAGLNIKLIETPGHTSCSVCYLVDNNIFTGDTLFLRSVGRWDLPTGSFEVLKNSIQKKLYVLDDNINVYPGHGNSTSIGYEKKFNMCINQD